MTPQTVPSVTLILRHGAANKPATLLQRGFLVPASRPFTIVELLKKLPGFETNYITARIQTIFVNGTAADTLEQVLTPGSTLALSAAMPGLAGAIFRRGGRHSSLRSEPVTSTQQFTGEPGYITIKLFNMIATERGPDILRGGVLVEGKTLTRFLTYRGESMQALVKQIALDGRQITFKELIAKTCNMPTLHLQIFKQSS